MFPIPTAHPMATGINPASLTPAPWHSREKDSAGSLMSRISFLIAASICVGSGSPVDYGKGCPEEETGNLSTFQYPYRKQRGILPIIDTHAGDGYTLGHLDDRKEGIKPHQLPAYRNSDDWAVGFGGHHSRESG
jgi:hypothetical protein